MKEEDDPNKGADSSSPNTDQTGTNDKRKHDTVNKDSESSKKKSIQSGIASIELNSAAGTLGKSNLILPNVRQMFVLHLANVG